jgi:hypothetical protein
MCFINNMTVTKLHAFLKADKMIRNNGAFYGMSLHKAGGTWGKYEKP